MFLAGTIREYYTGVIKIFWIVFGIGVEIVTFITLGLAIFDGCNELFAYVGGVWFLGLPIFAVLSYALYVVTALVGVVLEFVWEIMAGVFGCVKI